MNNNNNNNTSSSMTYSSMHAINENIGDAPINVQLFRRINVFILVAIHSAGVVTNLLMFVVFYRDNLRKLSVSTYIRWLAFFCVCQHSYCLLVYYTPTSYANQYEILCRLKAFFYFFIQPVCAWFEVAASLDRLLTIVYPNKSSLTSKTLHRRSLALSIIIFNLACYFNVLFDNPLTYTFYRDKVVSSACFIFIAKKEVIVDFIIGAAVPFILMAGLSVATFLGVLKSHVRAQSMELENTIRRKRSRDIRFGVTIIVINVVFVLFNLPHRLVYVLDNYSIIRFFRNTYVNTVFKDILVEFYEAYYSIIFLVQLVTNNQVRREFVIIIVRTWRLTKIRIFTN